MIYRITSNHSSFRSVTFEPGLNVIVADRTKESSNKDSRNGLGKTTLIEIIHFCLGASVRQNKGLLAIPDGEWIFNLELDLGGVRTIVSRSTEFPKYVIVSNYSREWPIQPDTKLSNGEEGYSIENWNLLLGCLLFGLTDSETEFKFHPSFRSLISYFARREAYSYINPFKHIPNQKEYDKQIQNSFLLGLNWRIASDYQVLNEKQKVLQQLKKAFKEGYVGTTQKTRGELEAEKARLEAKRSKSNTELKAFKVHPQYEEIEQEANVLTEKIHTDSNENTVARNLLALYKKDIGEETEPELGKLIKLYKELIHNFPEQVVSTLEQVQNFHANLIRNRKDFLADEIRSIENQVAERERKIQENSIKRAAILEILQTHGALQEYTKLQQRFLSNSEEINRIESQIQMLRKLDESRIEYKNELEHIENLARRDYEERQVERVTAIQRFNENTQQLYDAPGNLVIDLNEKYGYKFDIEILRSGSHGINNMKVFSYDLMISQLWSSHKFSPRFLIHDSILFDSVDERQIAHALELVASESTEKVFQYICMLNTDRIPIQDFSEGFDIDSYIRLRLTDEIESGGLLGIRF